MPEKNKKTEEGDPLAELLGTLLGIFVIGIGAAIVSAATEKSDASAKTFEAPKPEDVTNEKDAVVIHNVAFEKSSKSRRRSRKNKS